MSALLEVRDLAYGYPSGRGISGISFSVDPGEVVCIFGWNGSGKTTLLKVLATLYSPQSGSFSVAGNRIPGSRDPVRRMLFPVFDTSAHFGHLTGRENARFFLSLYGVSDMAALDRFAADFNLDLDRPEEEYSRGMKRKLLLAEAFASGRKVLVFDEPALGLDTGMCSIFFRLAREAAQAGSCVIIGTNRIEDAAAADRILFLEKGTLHPAESVETLIAGMISVTVSFQDRTLMEYIPAIDDLPRLVKRMLGFGIPVQIKIEVPDGGDSPAWTSEAEEKILRAPKFLQPMIRSLVGRYARENGIVRITPDVVDEVKGRFEKR